MIHSHNSNEYRNWRAGHKKRIRKWAIFVSLSLLLGVGIFVFGVEKNTDRPEADPLDTAASASDNQSVITAPGIVPSEPDKPDTSVETAGFAESDAVYQITNDAYQAQIDRLESMLPEGDSVTQTAVIKYAPELARMIDTDYPAVSLLCLSDLLSLDTSDTTNLNLQPLYDRYRGVIPEKYAPPSERQRIECELFYLLAEKYEPPVEPLSNYYDAHEWLADYFRRDICKRIAAHSANPDAQYYSEHPILQAYLIVMLREPVWRIDFLSPGINVLDFDTYFEAEDKFGNYMLYGELPQNLTIAPIPDDPRSLCTEKTVWTIWQNEDFSVILEVSMMNGDIYTLTYEPFK